METRKTIKSEIASGNITLARVASESGYSPAVISQWLSGKYTGNNDEVSKRLQSWLKVYLNRAQTPDKIPFCPTKNSDQILGFCSVIHSERKFAIIIGTPGLGKTYTLKEYAERNKGTVVYIECNPLCNSNYFFRSLHKALGKSGEGVLSSVYQDCVDVLHQTKQMLIIDEAGFLHYKTLELIRCLFDTTETGIVLAGMPILREKICGIQTKHEQLSSRISARLKLSALSKNDVEILVKSVIKTVNNDVIAEFCKICNGSARVVEMLLMQVIRMFENEDMTVQVVREAAKHLEV